MSEAYKKLIKTLRTLFEMDKADLDFGIYRILNQKRDEINRFLEQDLLPQVKAAFADYAGGGKSELQVELELAIEQAKQFGVPDPEQAPPVQAIRERLASTVDIIAVENEVYSYLHTFFSRYYDQGDFISQRRYKADTYAIPYEGEEVKLYWANYDQYYVKSSEHLRDYAFTVHDDDGKTVRIKLVEGDTEKDNLKAAADQERRFVLDAEKPLTLDGKELQIRFNYVPAGKKKQDALNAEAVANIFAQTGFGDWLNLLRKPAPTDANPKRTLLEKHLYEYTARNTYDYFIHRDLDRFLQQELDFYIKSEVLHLDDIDAAAYAVTEAHLRKIRILRTIALKIIRMLAQIEDFQKKLWLKKKIVVETQYCITLDRVPEVFFPEVAANQAQHDEWVRLYAINEIKQDLARIGYSMPLTVDFLRANQNLVLDTRFFNADFKNQLLASIDNLEEQCDGLLIHSDNYQALNLLSERYREQIKCIYIDPPYNTDAGPINYKNGYRSSSWLSMMQSRINKSKTFFNASGIHCITIDDYQQKELALLLENSFFAENLLGTIVIRNNPSGRSTVSGFSVCHEYAIFHKAGSHAELSRLPRTDKQLDRFTEENGELVNWLNFRKGGGAVTYRQERPKQYYPLFINTETLEIRIPNMQWNNSMRNWLVLDQTKPKEIQLLPIDDKGQERIWSLNHISAKENMADLKADYARDGTLRVLRRHIPTDGVLPRTWWDKPEYAAREHGSATLSKLFGDSVFAFAKSPEAVKDCLWIAGFDKDKGSTVLDYYAGSGTTGHAIVRLNREDGGKRRFILVETENYFDKALKPRIAKVIYSDSWKDGKPTNRSSGISCCFKYLRLESYEDTLNNLIIRPRAKRQQSLLDENPILREDYMLGYWLNVETAESMSLLNVDQFEDPFNYKLNIAMGGVGAFKPTVVDLVETFNYLLGLRVKHIDTIRGFKVVTGKTPNDESVLVIWRKVKELDNAALEAFMDKQGYNPRDTEFDRIYVNGDHTLEDPHSKVQITEIEFKRLMFDVQDV